MRTIHIASILLASTLGACAAQDSGPIQPGTDDLAGETGDGEAAKADAAHDTFGFIAVHRNAVTCSNPILCQVYRLDRANRTTMKCNDGQYHADCTVHTVSWESMGLSQTKVDQIEAALEAEVNGTKTGTQVLVKGEFKIYVDFLAFVPTEVWLAQMDGGNDSGTFVQVFDRGVRCVTAPCPTFEEDKLNSSKQANIESLDFGDSAADALQERVITATQTSGALVVGDRETRSEVSFVDTLRSVNQVYLPVK